MLPRALRLTTAAQFALVRAQGARGTSGPVTVQYACTSRSDVPGSSPVLRCTDAPRIAVVTGKSVGPAVERNRVRRRLQHAAAGFLAILPAHALVVIRVRPGAAQASSRDLQLDLDRSLHRAMGRFHARQPSASSARPL